MSLSTAGNCRRGRLTPVSRRVQYLATMKLTQRTRGLFVLIVGLSLIIGTFSWTILERILALAGAPLNLEAGPVGFDIGVIAASIHVNPGTLLGLVPGILIFKAL
ncbi:MAG TPA: hypothetical protein VMW87_11205 [Spirochaetia bacterium]|nr:hypothetical protein [Spirochaetia bacterium]